MSTKSTKPFTTARWTLNTFAGWTAGVALILLLSSLLDAAGIEHMQFYIGVGMGAGVGFMQWLMLRKHSNIGSGWIWLSILGMSLPFLLLDFFVDEGMKYRLPLSVGLGAVTTALLQYFLLKKKVTNAIPWIPVCICGWLLAMLMVMAVDYTKRLQPVISSNLLLALINLLLILGGGVMLGIVTGPLLKKILNRVVIGVG